MSQNVCPICKRDHRDMTLEELGWSIRWIYVYGLLTFVMGLLIGLAAAGAI